MAPRDLQRRNSKPWLWALLYFTQLIGFAFVYKKYSSQFYRSTSLYEPSLKADQIRIQNILTKKLHSDLDIADRLWSSEFKTAIDYQSKGHTQKTLSPSKIFLSETQPRPFEGTLSFVDWPFNVMFLYVHTLEYISMRLNPDEGFLELYRG